MNEPAIEQTLWPLKNSIPYGGYPDFKATGLVIQEVDIGPFHSRNKDPETAQKIDYVKNKIKIAHDTIIKMEGRYKR